MANVSCPAQMKASSNGAWQGDNPLDFAVPLAILQICLVVVLTRSLAFILRPLRQPRVIAEIIGGILLGPSALGRSKRFSDAVFPKRSLTVLDTLANIGLLFFLFLVGLELDLGALRRSGRRALTISLTGIALPFAMGIGTSFVLRATVSEGVRQAPFLVFMGVALSITAFPVLARILAELKLLTTDIGRLAMSVAAVDDVAAWVLLALAIALSGSSSPIVTLWVLLSAVAFVAAAFFLLRPLFAWIARDGEPVREPYVCATLVLVLAAAFATDAIGIHALFGAFLVGVFVPKDGPLGAALSEKIEDLVSALFLPLYFVSSGLKTNVATISGARSWGLLVLVITNACFGKIVGVILISLAIKIPPREAVTLGFLMNTKGLVELIVLNIGKDRKVLNDETFAIMVLMALFTTFITTPIVTFIYKPARRQHSYNRRSIETIDDGDRELRMLVCFRGIRDIPAVINLIESSRGARHHGVLSVYAMHLVELSERSSAISMVQKANRKGPSASSADQVVVSFDAYQRLSKVSVRPITAISNLRTIHEDIVSGAAEKRAALIVLPFHNQDSLGGGDYQRVNERVLRGAPCSVAVFVDRGLGGAAQVPSGDVSYAIAVAFFGGDDDREALALASRMSEHAGIAVTLMQFGIPGNGPSDGDKAFVSAVIKTSSSMAYEERMAEGRTEVIAAIRDAAERCDLFLVGRRSLAPTLVDRTDCPELGPVGSYLVSPEMESTTTSVLVVQKYDRKTNPSELTLETGTNEPENRAAAVAPIASPM